MENAVNAVNRPNKFYFEARKIFYNQQAGKHLGIRFPEEEGLKIRAALYVIVNRNPSVKKIFKSRKINKEILIWRVV